MKRTICHSEPKYWNQKYRSKKGNDLYVVGDDGANVRVMFVNHIERKSGHLNMSYPRWQSLIDAEEVSFVEEGKYVLTNRI